MRLFVRILSAALLASLAGMAIAAGGDHHIASATRIQATTMTDAQVQQKLESEGYTHVRIRERGKTYVEVTAAKDGKAEKLAVDPQSGQVMPEQDDDDD
jgi:hypothetical protein